MIEPIRHSSTDSDVPLELKNLKIDPELHRRLKVEAATRGVSLQQLTEAALAVGLAAPELVAEALAESKGPCSSDAP